MKMCREYIAYRSVRLGVLDESLRGDFRLKSFLTVMNVPDCGDIIAPWWDEQVKYFVGNNYFLASEK
jgi:hypothetical protein